MEHLKSRVGNKNSFVLSFKIFPVSEIISKLSLGDQRISLTVWMLQTTHHTKKAANLNLKKMRLSSTVCFCININQVSRGNKERACNAAILELSSCKGNKLWLLPLSLFGEQPSSDDTLGLGEIICPSPHIPSYSSTHLGAGEKSETLGELSPPPQQSKLRTQFPDWACLCPNSSSTPLRLM